MRLDMESRALLLGLLHRERQEIAALLPDHAERPEIAEALHGRSLHCADLEVAIRQPGAQLHLPARPVEDAA